MAARDVEKPRADALGFLCLEKKEAVWWQATQNESLRFTAGLERLAPAEELRPAAGAPTMEWLPPVPAEKSTPLPKSEVMNNDEGGN